MNYAVKYGLRDLLDVGEDVARRLAEAKAPELSEFGDVNFGVKTYATLIAYSVGQTTQRLGGLRWVCLAPLLCAEDDIQRS